MNEINICNQKKKTKNFFSNEDLDAYEAKQANTTSSLFTVETVNLKDAKKQDKMFYSTYVSYHVRYIKMIAYKYFQD